MFGIYLYVIYKIIHQVFNLAAAVDVILFPRTVRLLGVFTVPGDKKFPDVLRGDKRLGIESEILSLEYRGDFVEFDEPIVVIMDQLSDPPA